MMFPGFEIGQGALISAAVVLMADCTPIESADQWIEPKWNYVFTAVVQSKPRHATPPLRHVPFLAAMSIDLKNK